MESKQLIIESTKYSPFIAVTVSFPTDSPSTSIPSLDPSELDQSELDPSSFDLPSEDPDANDEDEVCKPSRSDPLSEEPETLRRPRSLYGFLPLLRDLRLSPDFDFDLDLDFESPRLEPI